MVAYWRRTEELPIPEDRTTDLGTVAFVFCERLCMALHSASLLGRKGFVPDSPVVARPALEWAIQLAYMANEPTSLPKRWIEYQAVVARRHLKILDALGVQAAKELQAVWRQTASFSPGVAPHCRKKVISPS